MDKKTSELLNQLKDGLTGSSDSQITEIVSRARDEALTEAKALIKEMMVQTILEQALRELAGAGSKAVPTEGEEQIRREIDGIRRKIAENEKLLDQARASPIEIGEEQEAPVAMVPREVEQGKVSAPTEATEEDYGYYVYGIVEDDGRQPIDGLPQEGIDPAYPVYTLPLLAISAIVSQVSLQEFGQEALEANLNDLLWLETKARAHQGVLEAVSASRTLIPMRFCTIHQSESRVSEMLTQYYDDFREALAHLEGKQEWGVKVYLDGQILAPRIGETSDRVKTIKVEMAQKSRGAAYFLEKKMKEAIAEEVERVSNQYAQRSHERLSAYGEETVDIPVQSRELTGRREMMVLNGVYLVAEDQLAGFRAELESLEQEYGDLGFLYEMTGPWPLYNFVSIGSEKGTAHE